MRIVVNDIAASVGGARTVLDDFYRYVCEFDQDNEWIFLLGSDMLEWSDRVHTVVLPRVKGSWLRRLTFDLVSGGRLIRALNPDVIFSLQNTYTYWAKSPQVVYVHQSLPFQEAKRFSVWRRDERLLAIYQKIIGGVIKESIRRADHVIVQTRWMRDAILDQVGIPEGKIDSVLPDLDDLSRHVSEGELDVGAFAYPTTLSAYKNNDCLFSACDLLRQQGITDFTVTMTVDLPTPRPNIVAVGRIPRERVLGLLSKSTLVFPSLTETYGLPLAEARALGTIVLAADLPYAREVLDGYVNAYFFNPASPSQLAVLMSRVINGSISRVRDSQGVGLSGGSGGQPAWARIVDVLEASARKADYNATR